MDLFEALEAAEATEQARQARVRALFEARTGHPRGIVPLGEEGKLWWQLQAEDPSDDAAADLLASNAIDAWLAGGAADRARLGVFFARAAYLRWRLGWPTGAAIRAIADSAPGDATGLARRALAGIVLDGANSDWRDLVVALDGLCVAAFRAGIDPVPLIAEAMEALPAGHAAEPIRHVLAPYVARERSAAVRRPAETP